MKVPESILEKIAEQIKAGFTSGLEDDGSIRASWDIDIEVWDESETPKGDIR